MPRLHVFRVAALAVPVLLAATTARGAGSDTSSAGPIPRSECSVPSPPAEREPLVGRAGRIESTPAAPRADLPAPSEASPVSISINKPLHLADFLLQTHTAFHLAARIEADETSAARRLGEGPGASGWTSPKTLPITWRRRTPSAFA